jgi:hypothetical protein
MSSVIFQAQSFLIVALMIYGVYHRRNRFKHVKIMKTVIIWDLLLVAQIELTRGAINTASKAMTNPVILNIHISLAVSTVLLYVLIGITGTKLKNGNEGLRKVHKGVGIITLTTRIATLITSNLI